MIRGSGVASEDAAEEPWNRGSNPRRATTRFPHVPRASLVNDQITGRLDRHSRDQSPGARFYAGSWLSGRRRCSCPWLPGEYR